MKPALAAAIGLAGLAFFTTVYPACGDPFAQQAYLKALNTGAGDNFGASTAISGNTVVVGAPYEDSNATGVNGNPDNNGALDSGAAYVYVRDGEYWVRQAYLKASNTGAGDLFGWSVAISGDTVVVGAWGESSGATGVNGDGNNNRARRSGAAYVFVREGTNWTQQAYLKASNTGGPPGDDMGDRFGMSVAVSGDTAIVGAWLEDSAATGVDGDQNDDNAPNSGAAYVFRRTGTRWAQEAYLKAGNSGPFLGFGWAVAVGQDTAVVGAGAGLLNSGGAYIFRRSGTEWVEDAYLTGSNVQDAEDAKQFGHAVGISGGTVVVGAPFDSSSSAGVNGPEEDTGAPESGAAYVFVRSNTAWTRQAYLKASNTGSGDRFGQTVALDGDLLVIGAPREDCASAGVNLDQTNDNASNAGAAYLFKREGTGWSQLAYLKASNTGADDLFGEAVSISSDTLIVAAPGESSNATGVNGDQGSNHAAAAGAAYVFSSQALRPDLVIAQSGRQVALAWPVTADGFALEWSASVGSPASWHLEPTPPAIVGDQNVVTLEVGAAARFFRLRKP